MKIEKMKYDSERAAILLYRILRLFPFNPKFNEDLVKQQINNRINFVRILWNVLIKNEMDKVGFEFYIKMTLTDYNSSYTYENFCNDFQRFAGFVIETLQEIDYVFPSEERAIQETPDFLYVKELFYNLYRFLKNFENKTNWKESIIEEFGIDVNTNYKLINSLNLFDIIEKNDEYLLKSQEFCDKINEFLKLLVLNTIQDEENRKIGNLDKPWMGNEKTQHIFHFNVIKMTDGVYGFIHVPPYVLPDKAQLLAEQAIKCISNTKKDENGKDVSAMKPESAAAWLGAMSHFFCDLVSPAHLLAIADYEHVYVRNTYHDWFERQLGQLTFWDQYSIGGPMTEDLLYDRDVNNISPLKPSDAATSLAIQAINIAYRTDGNHQYVENDMDSGLYINNSIRNGLSGKDYMLNWDWDADISENGINSVHEHFYDKIEKLLGYANYYCARAMQWVYNEAQKKLNETTESDTPDSHYFAKNPIPPKTIPNQKKPLSEDKLTDSSKPTTSGKGFSKESLKTAAKLSLMVVVPTASYIPVKLWKLRKKSGKTTLKTIR